MTIKPTDTRCPTCYAKPGEYCRSTKGKLRSTPHRTRIHTARRASIAARRDFIDAKDTP